MFRLPPLLLFCLSFASAQETRSTLNGRVYDAQSAAIAGAKVAITHVDTNAVTHVVTNETGYYEAPLLLPGNYRITASSDGFKTTTRSGIVLAVGQQLAVELKLE